MKTVRLFTAVLSLAVLAARPAAAQGFDPSFAAPSVYAPGTTTATLEQPDGKRVVAGSFVRIDGTPVSSRVVRFNPDGTLDTPFLQNVGPSTLMQRMHLLSNGQILLIGLGGATTAGGITRQDLVRLNADGTADASFDAGTGPEEQGTHMYLDDAVSLPNGKVVAVGPFDHFDGAVANYIVGLTSTGALDPTFNPGTGANAVVRTVVALPSGKLLIGGFFTSYNGNPCQGLARLNADGSFDATFSRSVTALEVINIVVQPDGKILISGTLQANAGLMRLNADGSIDNSFTIPTQLYPNTIYGDGMQVQPDGKILVINSGPTRAPVVRLNADGTVDASYQSGTNPIGFINSITLLASGKSLVMGSFTEFNGTTDRTLVQLTSTGAVDASFLPKIQTNGGVNALARQADGKYVVGGTFSEINGQVARRLARFNADGSLDAAFSTNTGGLGVVVNDLALQPDGKVLAAAGAQVRRFLASGSPDNGFTAGTFVGTPNRLLLQPDGKVLVGGTHLSYNGQSAPYLLRLTAAGTHDNTFVPATTGANSISQFHSMALQPDGKLLVAAYVRPASGSAVSRVLRLSATGAVDATYTSLPITSAGNVNSSTFRATNLVLQPDGKLLLAGAFGAVGGAARGNVARLNADGTLDAGFVPATFNGAVSALALQPNNRVLLGGSFSAPNLSANLTRLNADGTADASYLATAVPNSIVRTLLVQADGGIMAGGFFTGLSGQPAMALARISAPNVLHAALPQAVADRTQAWPVPARTTLHVRLDPGARAQTLELLDVLGRPVRQQALGSAADDATVAVDGLPTGQYLLRVHYAQGAVTRRVSVQ
ncbi:T9SS type A sorting domain-containing protein [Hymenobacter edaphi]|uniref:Secretion system C-terminal sorting domain-containing protein n=1 Tax=Hymenobacter edaphi TaxID=2211146 RepID=A0A328BSX9_9BACT|nr:T9SS type A sorting domain-containing protein [Hymenobacter edaphi]RAK70153.1 hypothetical protein DLM85_04695 [Hymenobacter edaphi]